MNTKEVVETLIMTLDNVDSSYRFTKHTELPQGYCLEECPTDKKKIADIWYDIAKQAFGDDLTYNVGSFLAKYLILGKYQKNGIFIVRHQMLKENIGFVMSWLPNPDEHLGQLHWLCVKPGHQGKGIGRYLVGKVLTYFRDENCIPVVFLKTEVFREKAIAFYKDFGFVC